MTNHDLRDYVKMIKIRKIALWVLTILPYILISLLILNLKFDPPGPDSELYYGLAENLINKTGFIDTIRNDEILPAIGYPLLIAFAIKLDLSALFFAKASSLVAFFLLFRATDILLNKLFATLFIFFFYLSLPRLNLWGIELAILVSTAILIYSFVCFHIEQSVFSYLCFSAAFLFHLLIRPLLMPLLYFVTPVGIYFFFRKTEQRKELLFSLLFIWAFLFSISSYSTKKYGDRRMLIGTYSAIPLYCAWNRFIPLDQNYASTVWNSLDENVKEVAIAPLQNTTGWKNRDGKLKEEVLQFVIDAPATAIWGFFWRISKFTIRADNSYYKAAVFLGGFLLFFTLLNLKNIDDTEKILFLFTLGVALYVLLMTALFPFAGERYYLMPSMFLLLFLAISMHILAINKTRICG